MRRYEVVICAALLAASCSHLSAPPQLSPAGDVAWHARQAVIIVDTMVKATTDGVKSGVITKADGAKVAAAAEVAMKAGNGLVEALEAGMPEAGAKDQFLAALRAALMNLPNQLDSETAKRISIYTDGALKLLSVFGK